MKPFVIASLLAAAWLTACVTINIYFPAAAAEKVADRIIDEVWQLPANPAASQPQSPSSAKEPT